MAQKKTHISITLDTAVADRLREITRRDTRSLSGLINHILKEYLRISGTK